jgi:hypothetical protein
MLTLGDNPSAIALAFTKLERAGSITVTSNASLENAALPALVEIEGDLTIASNASLPALTLRSLENVGGSMIVSSNDSLVSLGELARLQSVGMLTIGGNPSLSQCEVDDLAERLGACSAGSCTGNGGCD